MNPLTIKFTLASDTTLGGGIGSVAVTDVEVSHDPNTGLPFYRSTALKGVLVESVQDLLTVFNEDKWVLAAITLFGQGGTGADAQGILRFENAQLDLTETLHTALLGQDKIPTKEVLELFTTIRTQTAIEAQTGSAKEASLRRLRVLYRGLRFKAIIHPSQTLSDAEKTLLAAAVAGIKRIGLGRNRGAGLLASAQLYEGQTLLNFNGLTS